MVSNEAPGCLGFIFRLFGVTGERPTGPLPYRTKDDFLSPAEASFFRVLKLVAGDRFTIFAKVRLADLFYVSRPHEHRGAFNRIAQRHVDFVLCDPATLRPILGLELDDASHRSSRAAEGDRFKDEVFGAAGLPLSRIPARRAYETAEVAALLSAALGESGPRCPEERTGTVALQRSPGSGANDEAARALSLDDILVRLDRYQQAVTYGAMATLLGLHPRTLMTGRPRDQLHSWLVNKDTRLPSGYQAGEMHPALVEAVASRGVIGSADELKQWLTEHP